MSDKDKDRLIELANEFVKDVLPQAAGLCIQRYDHLNEMCMLLTDWEKSQ